MKSKREIHIIRLKNGLKCLKYTLNGKQCTLYAKTTRELREKYAHIKGEIKRPLRSGLTFLAWYEKWLQVYKTDLKQNSLYILKCIFNKYVLPRLGKKNIKRITSTDIQELINSMQKVKRQQTVVFMQVNACMQQAYKLNLIAHNPCLACVIKKTKGNKGKALTKEQQAILLEYLNTHYVKIKNLILLYLNTGMRCSELLNLTKQDINRETNEILIRGTKTKNIKRILQTSKQVIDLIPDREKPFDNWNKDKVDRAFKNITNELGFEKITIHSLRHTFATNCIESGVDMVVLQNWLGHSSISMTIDRYTHISEDYKRQEQSKLKILK